jgi:hypothetical protein
MANTLVVLTVLLTPGSASTKLSLDNISTAVTITVNTLTAAAVVIGGVWAYFKYAKGRTFRPRLEVILLGQWQNFNGRHLLQARITVKNVGASKIALLQEGTGLKVSLFAKKQPVPPDLAKWDRPKVFSVLTEHAWIEPGETVSDDLLLDLATSDPVPTLLEGRLICCRRRGNIEVFARKVIPADATIGDTSRE